MNSGGQNPVARQVYSSFAPMRERASDRISAWSKASGPVFSTGTQRARSASPPPSAAGSGMSGTRAVKATETTRIRGSRSGSLYVRSCSRWSAPTTASGRPVSSASSRRAAVSADSLGSRKPPGSAQAPAYGSWPRRISRTCSAPPRTVNTARSTVTAKGSNACGS